MSINRGTDKENVVHMCNEISVVVVLIVKSCLTLCNPKDFSSPGFFVHGISQAIILEWVAISFFKGSSQPWIESRSPAWQADYLPSEPTGRPQELQKFGANHPDLRRIFKDFSKPPMSKIC